MYEVNRIMNGEKRGVKESGTDKRQGYTFILRPYHGTCDNSYTKVPGLGAVRKNFFRGSSSAGFPAPMWAMAAFGEIVPRYSYGLAGDSHPLPLTYTFILYQLKTICVKVANRGEFKQTFGEKTPDAIGDYRIAQRSGARDNSAPLHSGA
jgi:hypothetical protein